MRRTKALKRRLETLAHSFYGGPVKVKWGTPPHATQDFEVVIDTNVSRFVGTNKLTGPNEFRFIVNTLNHEVSHLLVTDLTAKQRIGNYYQEKEECGELAGFVFNVLEDQYIDRWRTDKWKGLRGLQAYYVITCMSNNRRRGRIDSKPVSEGFIEGLFQIAFSGYAQGYTGADPKLQDFLAWLRVIIKKYRYEDNQEERERLAHQVIQKLIADVPNLERAKNAVKEINAPLEPPITEFGAVTNGPETQDSQEKETGNKTKQTSEDPLEVHHSEGSDGSSPHTSQNENPPDSPVDSDSNDSEISETEVLDERDHLEKRDGSDKPDDWYNISDDTDYQTPSEDIEQEYHRIRNAVELDQTNEQKRVERRNESSRDPPERSSEHVRQELIERDIVDSIADAFYRLKTRDVRVPSRTGSQVDIGRTIRHVSGDYSETRTQRRKRRAELGDRAVGVALDLSGSMDVFEAKIALSALYLATAEINDQFVASGFRTISSMDGKPISVCPLITAPTEDFEWHHLDAVTGNGHTPTARGIYRASELLDDCHKPEKVLFVITDGLPNTTIQGKRDIPKAREQTYNAIQDVRNIGIRVVGIGVGPELDTHIMDSLFGKDGHITVESYDFTDELIRAYYNNLSVT